MVHFDQDTDVVTGLKQKTHYGRPNWEKEFEQVRNENPTQVYKSNFIVHIQTHAMVLVWFNTDETLHLTCNT